MAVSTEALRKLQKGLGLWIRLQRSALLVLVGLLITGVSNELHLKFERENARKSEVTDAIEKYERLTSLYALASAEDRTAIFNVMSEHLPDTESKVKALPFVNRHNSEISIALGGLDELARHLKGADADKAEVDRIAGISMRLEPGYRGAMDLLKGHFDRLPADPEVLKNLTTMLNVDYKYHNLVGSEYPQLEDRILIEARVEGLQKQGSSRSELSVMRLLAWLGIVISVVAAFLPKVEKSATFKVLNSGSI